MVETRMKPMKHTNHLVIFGLMDKQQLTDYICKVSEQC